jgi:N-acetylglucosaminyl-diphospho-decaprenol L-rhamnosyltransferase
VSAVAAGGRAPILDVVVVNWNAGDCLRACLDSLAQSATRVSLGHVVVVDNASTDGSAGSLPTSPPVTLVRNQENVGFAAASNQGARLGSGEYVLFLNPDTVLLTDTLQTALTFMEGPEGVRFGICGGSVLDVDGSLGISASRFPTLANVAAKTIGLDRVVPRLAPPRHLPPEALTRSCQVDQVIGAFFLVRRSLFDQLGGFDERYFLYYDEVDFSLRARTLGFDSYFLAEARLHHVGGVSARKSGGRALYHSLRSRTLYAFRHWPRPQACALVALTVAVELPARLARAVLHRSPAEITAVAWAFGSYLRFLARPGRRQRGPRLPSRPLPAQPWQPPSSSSRSPKRRWSAP